MSEGEFHFFYKAAVLVTVLLHAGCFTAFFHPFLTDTTQEFRPRSLRLRRPHAGILFLIYSSAYLLCAATPVPQIACVILIGAGLLSLSGILRADRSLLFLLTVLFFSTRTSSALIIESLDYLSGHALFRLDAKPELILLRAAAVFTLVSLLRFALFAVMLYALRRRLLQKTFLLRRRELYFLCLIPMTGILSGGIIVRLLGMIKDGVYLRLYEQHPVFLGIIPLIAALFYAGTWFTIAFHQEMLSLQTENEACFVKEQHLNALQKRAEEQKALSESMEQMRREMLDHLRHIRELAHNGSYEEIGQYLRQTDQDLRIPDLAVRTGNAVTDVVLNEKRRQALRAGISLEADFHYPASGRYEAYDLGIILHNLLENALEACAQVPPARRYIRLTGKQRKRFYLIQAENPYQGRIVMDPVSGLPVSTKQRDSRLHGIGLSSVRQEAAKYQGDLEIRTEEQIFHITILLQERSSHL